ncbi:MAG TPA: hypothetical protein VKA46_05265 [Gemmataceae bacterium]|nr:hypothetical protein [Gemmataceae bacterium]
MTRDPIVEEIRKFREEDAARHGDDLHAICEAIREEERKSGRTFVRLTIRKSAPPPVAPEAPAPLEQPQPN